LCLLFGVGVRHGLRLTPLQALGPLARFPNKVTEAIWHGPEKSTKGKEETASELSLSFDFCFLFIFLNYFFENDSGFSD
jgi:hypothetical protein